MKGTDIVKVAKSFIGQTEIKGNQGFENTKFQQIMESVGWQKGHAWCCYFSEVCWTLAVKDDRSVLKQIDKLFSGSCVRTLQKFSDAGFRPSSKAVEGSVVIWRTRKNGVLKSTGHAGIVIEVHDDHFVTVEGNTNSGGVREGEIVAVRKRKFDFDVFSGLELQGFLHPFEDEKRVRSTEQNQLPFKNKTEGNRFRRWVNDNHPDVAKQIDLDRSGSHKNSYILNAYEILGSIYRSEQ